MYVYHDVIEHQHYAWPNVSSFSTETPYYRETTPSLTVIEITMILWTPDVIATTQSTALPQSIPVIVCKYSILLF